MVEPDYLWDREGDDPEVAHLEEIFGQLRVEQAPPQLPARRRRWVPYAAAAALMGGAIVVGDALLPPAPEDGPSPASAPVTATTGEADPAPSSAPTAPPRSPAPTRDPHPDVEPPDEGPAVLVERDGHVRLDPGPVLYDDGEPTGLVLTEEGQVITLHDRRIRSPRLSPDGTRIAFEVTLPAEKRVQLWVGELTGTQVHALTRKHFEGATSHEVQGLAWSHHGRFPFAYSATDESGAVSLHAPPWAPIVGGENRQPAWDPTDGRLVFSSTRTGSGDLYLWDPDQGGAPLQLTFDDTNAEVSPEFIPDGERVVYVRSGRTGSDLILLDLTMFSSLPLVDWDRDDAVQPSPAPDGRRVAFAGNRETDSPDRFDAWMTDLRAGAAPVRLAGAVRRNSHRAWSWTPEGDALVASLEDPEGGDCVALIPADGSGAECLDLGTVHNRDPHLVGTDEGWLLTWASLDEGGGRALNIARLRPE